MAFKVRIVCCNGIRKDGLAEWYVVSMAWRIWLGWMSRMVYGQDGQVEWTMVKMVE